MIHIVHQHQRVAHGDAGQREHAEDGKERWGHVQRHVTEERADRTHRDDEHHVDGLGKRLEGDGQQRIDRHQQRDSPEDRALARFGGLGHVALELERQSLALKAQLKQPWLQLAGDADQVHRFVRRLRSNADHLRAVVALHERGCLGEPHLGHRGERDFRSAWRSDAEVV